MSTATEAPATAQPVLDRLGLPAPEGWPVERVISALAGTMTLVSLGLARAHDRRWRLLTAFIGFNLVLQSAVGWCPASGLLYRLGVPLARERDDPHRCASR